MTGLDPREVARLLRQRREMGAPPLVLERGGRDALMASLAAAARGGPAAALRPPPADGGRAVSPAVAPRAAAAPPSSTAAAARPTPGAASAGGAAASTALPVLPDDYAALREVALGCTLCDLSESRTRVVFSDGPPDASVMVVGEAPGANEDATGLPFVGAAGRLLDLLLMSVDLTREEDVYICNVLKCRPPGNRNPEPDEIETCTPYLRKQIELVRPRAILGVGTFAARFLTGTTSALGKLRGEVYAYEGVPVVVTYHPAALLRNGSWTRPTWDDLQLLRRVVDGG